MAFMDSVVTMDKEKMLNYLYDMYVQCYKTGNKDKAKAYLDIYERVNNCEYDID